MYLSVKPTTTKKSTINLPGVIAKSDDADLLRELIQDAAQRLMEFDRQAVNPGDRSRGE